MNGARRAPMTAGELIERLRSVPPDALVWFEADGGYAHLTDVDEDADEQGRPLVILSETTGTLPVSER
jgi:hypothetical protein